MIYKYKQQRGFWDTSLCPHFSYADNRGAESKHDPYKPIPSQGFPCCQIFHTSSIFIFDMRFVLRNDCTWVSSEAQLIWALGTKALSLHGGIYFCLLAFKIRKKSVTVAKQRTENRARFCHSYFTLPLPAPHRKPQNM